MTETLSARGLQALPLPNPLPFPWEGQMCTLADRPASEHFHDVTTGALPPLQTTARVKQVSCAAAKNFVDEVVGNVDPNKWDREEKCSKQ